MKDQAVLGGTVPKKAEKLTLSKVAKLTKPGRYADGNGLYLQLSKSGASKSWIFRYTVQGRTREMGLGPCSVVSLYEARNLAIDCRRSLLTGQDPIESRRRKKAAESADRIKSITFDQLAASYIRAHESKWSNAKHRDQWASTIKTYASPAIGRLPVQEIDTALIVKFLEPIWRTKTETASRVRGRVERILSFAKAQGLYTRENPARWIGHLDQILPKPSEITEIKHHTALPVADLPEFMAELRAQDCMAALALEFMILTAARTSEALQAEWREFDLEQKLWVVPAKRMKHGKEHRVPLSERTVAILRKAQKIQTCTFVFFGMKQGRPLSNTSCLQLLARMQRKVTAHGFRSTFRDWAAEQTNFPRDVVEMALAHTIENKVEAAYRRGDLLPKRHRLMSAWDGFCARAPKPHAEIIEIQRVVNE